MIKLLHAHIAIVTVCGSWGSVDKTCIAKFNLLWMGFDCAGIKNGFVFSDLSSYVVSADWNSPEIGLLEITKNFGDDAWINKCQNDHKSYSGKMEQSR